MYQALGYGIQYVAYNALLVGTITLMSRWLNIEPVQHHYQSLDGTTTVHLFYLTAAITVGLFFMLSGFLFFKKILSDNLNIPRFFIGRIKCFT